MYYTVLLFSGVCMVCSGLSFLFLGVYNMSDKCGDQSRCVGVESVHFRIMVLLFQLLVGIID